MSTDNKSNNGGDGDLADLVATSDIADRFGVQPGTVYTWRQKPQLGFPAPRGLIGGRPVWVWDEVREWGIATRRLTATGEVVPLAARQQYGAVVVLGSPS